MNWWKINSSVRLNLCAHDDILDANLILEILILYNIGAISLIGACVLLVQNLNPKIFFCFDSRFVRRTGVIV